MIGLGPAQTHRRFDSAVPVIEQGAQIAGRADPDMASALARLPAAEGIAIRTGIALQRTARATVEVDGRLRASA